jgi:ribose transport system ATP-binding protein
VQEEENWFMLQQDAILGAPSTLPGAETRTPILEVRNISKRFPGVIALDNVSVQFYPGEVHAVVGENGAGKSTLMKILAGAYIPDSGEILLNGQKVGFAHPVEAQRSGISIIYQELNLLPERTVAENIFLGREPARFGVIDTHSLEKQTVELLRQLDTGHEIPPMAQLGSLSVAEQQMVEIAKAISFDSKVLIMDEPTAALSSNEVEILSRLIARLKSLGMAIVFISHRLKEVFDLAELVTVLKDGNLVATMPVSQLTPPDVIRLMVGRDLDHYFPPLAESVVIGDTVLQVRDAGNDFLKNINLQLRAGEIVGLAGLQGSGRTSLAQALFGVYPFRTGTVELEGEPVMIKGPAQAIKYRMGLVTEDRKSEGILPRQPLRDNILVTIRALKGAFSLVRRDGVKGLPNLVPDLIKQVDVRAASFDQELQFLSGGNQQKVILAKWLASAAKVLIFDEPTRGIDVEAKASIHDMIRGLANEGAAVLMISSELPEIIGMSDRIVVMWDGMIVGELPAASSEAAIMLLATGHGNELEQNSVSPLVAEV